MISKTVYVNGPLGQGSLFGIARYNMRSGQLLARADNSLADKALKGQLKYNTFRNNCCIVNIQLIWKCINRVWWSFFFTSSSLYSQIPPRVVPTGGIPETPRKWSTSTLPSGCPSPVWDKPCHLSPSSPVQHWWQLLWLHPDHLQRLKSLASHWEPSLPERNRSERNSLKMYCFYSLMSSEVMCLQINRLSSA